MGLHPPSASLYLAGFGQVSESGYQIPRGSLSDQAIAKPLLFAYLRKLMSVSFEVLRFYFPLSNMIKFLCLF